MMLLPKWCIIVLIVFFDTMRYNIVEMCTCKTYKYKPYASRTDYLGKLANSKKIKDLALIGTHSSFSYSVNLEKLKTQDLNIVQQLEYGIRVFDVGVRPQSNLFEIYVGSVATYMEFSAALVRIDKFLNDNPNELAVLNIYKVHSATSDVTKSNCDIINYYIDDISVGRRLVKKWRLNDNIGMYRGKILLTSTDNSFSDCTFNINRNCEIQDDDLIAKNQSSTNTIYTKWMLIVNAMRDSYYYNDCYINNISFGGFDYGRRVIAKDGGYKYHNVCVRPLNDVMAEFFKNPHRALVIILSDFVTQELIDKIIDSNSEH